jgi:pyruvate,water dikinase
MGKYVAPLHEFRAENCQECGGKAANLGELINLGINVPPGFCVKSNVYYYLVESNNINERITRIVENINFSNPKDMEEKTAQIRPLIINANLPKDLQEELLQNYQNLKEVVGKEPMVAVRSSVAVKDSDISSFPGLMDTYHYICGFEPILQKIKECIASVWTSRATFIRHRKKIEHSNALITAIVQQMVDSEVSGVMFTVNPMTSSPSEVLITSCWGLGELIVSGECTADMYILNKTDLSLKSPIRQKWWSLMMSWVREQKKYQSRKKRQTCVL